MDCSSFGSYYSTLASIVITLFSVSGIALLYFGNLHERTGRAALTALASFGIDEFKILENNAKAKVTSTKTLKELDENSLYLERIFAENIDTDAVLRNNPKALNVHRELSNYNQEFSLNNYVSIILSAFVLFSGIIVPMYMLRPNPNTLGVSCEKIAAFAGLFTLFFLIVLWGAYLMSPKKKEK